MAISDRGAGHVIAERYELTHELGRGGMGVVWRARDRALNRDVAIKQVHLPDHLTAAGREEAHARIRREAQTAAQIPHPSVVTIHDILDYGESPWIVMQLINGDTLQERLETTGPLPVDRVRTIAEALLGALHTAHQEGVVHRDVKPANILLTEDGRAVLTDFGIAAVDGGTALTRTGTLIGSPEYMAPERLEHEQALPASDLWSLGATLHAACEGQSPFHRETVTGTITAVITGDIPEPVNAGELGALLSGLLTRDTAERVPAEQALELLEGTGRTRNMQGRAAPTRTVTGPVSSPSQPGSGQRQPSPTPPRMAAPESEGPHQDSGWDMFPPSRPPEPRPAQPPTRPPATSRPAASRPATAPTGPAAPAEPRYSGAGQDGRPDLPGTMHALRALLLFGAAWHAMSWFFVLGADSYWHFGEIPHAALWFIQAVAFLILGLRASTGGAGVFGTTIGLAVAQLAIILIDVSSGYDITFFNTLSGVFLLVYVLQTPSRRFLLRNVG